MDDPRPDKSDLVKRLREPPECNKTRCTVRRLQAADRIEQLEAQVVRLRRGLEDILGTNEMACYDIARDALGQEWGNELRPARQVSDTTGTKWKW